MRRIAAGLIALSLLAAACTPEEAATTTTQPGATTTTATTSPVTGTTRPVTGTTRPVTTTTTRFDPSTVQFVAALERFDRCDAFLDYIRAEALSRVGPYGLEGGNQYPWLWRDGDRFFGAEGDAARAQTFTTAAAAGVPGVDFSTSNVQVAGVDEPDIIKTDGTRIVAIVDNVLYYVDVSGDEPVLTDRIRIGDGWNHRFFLGDDRILVFSGGGGFIAEPWATDVARILPPSQPYMTITEVDISDPDDLSIGRTLTINGNFVSARLIDGTVRVVVSSYPAGLTFVYPSGPSAEDVAEAANRRIIEESTLETWLPGYALSDGDRLLAQGILGDGDCSRIHKPAEFAGFEMLSVLTLELGGDLEPGEATTLTARGETVYASTTSLYVTTNVWVPSDVTDRDDIAPFEQRYETAIHQFDITGDAPAEYLASGSVEGHLLNQFSMDEWNGNLRIATTAGAPWGFSDESESFVHVFRRDGDRLVRIGKVGDLGRGERIFSARFIEDQAYIVTFRQVDPLYIVDLSDPTVPVVTGELKIPGYSSYLHPLGGDRLLGVGQDADSRGVTDGTKVSLFDVSDPTNPIETDTWTLRGGYSDAEWDHLAFLYWAPENAAVLPLQSWGASFFGAVVLDTEGGLEERARIEHDLDEIDRGATDCRRITEADLGGNTELPREVIVQVCGEEDPGGAAGYFCEVLPADELRYITEEVSGVDLTTLVGEGERLELCWPEYEDRFPVIRSLVIGDTLWTLTRGALQANDFADLDEVAVQIVLK